MPKEKRAVMTEDAAAEEARLSKKKKNKRVMAAGVEAAEGAAQATSRVDDGLPRAEEEAKKKKTKKKNRGKAEGAVAAEADSTSPREVAEEAKSKKKKLSAASEEIPEGKKKKKKKKKKKPLTLEEAPADEARKKKKKKKAVDDASAETKEKKAKKRKVEEGAEEAAAVATTKEEKSSVEEPESSSRGGGGGGGGWSVAGEDVAAVDAAESAARDVVATASPSEAGPEKEVGDTTILLFYAYVAKPMSYDGQTEAIRFCTDSLKRNGCSGRLRIAREGYNGTLTGPRLGIRAFTASLATLDPGTFGEGRVDFKYVDNLPDKQRLKGIKCWPVTEIVTYGFDTKSAPLHLRGTHLTPEQFHAALADPDAVCIDVRNFNETLIGKFEPRGGAQILDPCMRRSTEFPDWVERHKPTMEGKKVLMYCTGGVRCERASAFMRGRGVQNVFQLEGGIHRYLERYEDDGGHWVGKNYTFDRRFSHGARNADVISRCVHCAEPWDRYQAKAKCAKCAMEVLLCRPCQRRPEGPPPKPSLRCPLCCATK